MMARMIRKRKVAPVRETKIINLVSVGEIGLASGGGVCGGGGGGGGGSGNSWVKVERVIIVVNVMRSVMKIVVGEGVRVTVGPGIERPGGVGRVVSDIHEDLWGILINKK